MPFTSDNLSPFLGQIKKAGHIYLGYSGGLDSQVLLHALSRLISPAKITALHINHRLSAQADGWQAHCRQQAESLGVHFIAEAVTVNRQGQGLEQAARQARYATFANHLQAGDLLLLAHHSDDQVETVLYRLLRGSGPRGLSGMPQCRPLGKGQLLRPLLGHSRSDLQQYAQAHHLQWIEDESNDRLDFDRNYLRHQVVPALARRWPDYRARIRHSAESCHAAEQLLEEVAAQDLQACFEQKERLGWSLAIAGLVPLSAQRQSNLLHHWIRRHQLPLPGRRALETVRTELLSAREDALPLVSWPGGEFRRYRQRLYLLGGPMPPPEPGACLAWNFKEPLLLPDGSLLTAKPAQGQGLRLPASSPITVCFRQGGERCQPAGRQGSNTLKKILQEAQLEPWLRDRVPLICAADSMIAVGDLFVCEGAEAKAGQAGVRLSWQYIDK